MQDVITARKTEPDQLADSGICESLAGSEFSARAAAARVTGKPEVTYFDWGTPVSYARNVDGLCNQALTLTIQVNECNGLRTHDHLTD